YQVSTKYGEWKKGEPYSVTYKNDNTVAAGKEYVETTGVNGSSISIVRTVKDAGGNILHQDLFESNYEPKNEVIVKGTRS
ncbi:MAG: G5 domain-containing protein, partial [Eggerthellaceae bacterium]